MFPNADRARFERPNRRDFLALFPLALAGGVAALPAKAGPASIDLGAAVASLPLPLVTAVDRYRATSDRFASDQRVYKAAFLAAGGRPVRAEESAVDASAAAFHDAADELIRAALAAHPGADDRLASAAVFVVPDPDPLAVAAGRLARALDALESVLGSYDRVIEYGDVETLRRFEDVVLEGAYRRADDAEQAFLNVCRARGKAGVKLGDRLFLDDGAQAYGAVDRWRKCVTIMEIPTIEAL
jgi:hypothetical protein